MEYVSILIPSIGTLGLLSVAVLHVHEGFPNNLAWARLRQDIISTGEETKANATRTCNAETWQRGVILVTTASYEKVKEFDGVEKYYLNVWQNRRAFTEQHGL